MDILFLKMLTKGARMAEKYFDILSSYFALIVWFAVLISAKISQLSAKKKLSRGQFVSNVLYAFIGGVLAYFGTNGFQQNIRVIAVAFGVLSGDVIVGWIPKNAESFLESLKDIITKYLQKKK